MIMEGKRPEMGASLWAASLRDCGRKTWMSSWPRLRKKSTHSWMPRQEKTSCRPCLGRCTVSFVTPPGKRQRELRECDVGAIDEDGPEGGLAGLGLFGGRRRGRLSTHLCQLRQDPLFVPSVIDVIISVSPRELTCPG